MSEQFDPSSDAAIGPDWPPMPDTVWTDLTFFGLCLTCEANKAESTICIWVDCPTGGWWSHKRHPADGHEADIGWQPEQQMDDHGHYGLVARVVQ